MFIRNRKTNRRKVTGEIVVSKIKREKGIRRKAK